LIGSNATDVLFKTFCIPSLFQLYFVAGLPCLSSHGVVLFIAG
jgi:hypothetical protein